MPSSRLVGLVLVVISACSFGSGALFAKPVYGSGVDWLTLLSWRFLIGATLSWALVLATTEGRAAVRRLSRRAALASLALGVLYVGNSGTYFAALESVSASLAALIVYVYPAVVAVLSLRVGRPLAGLRAWSALVLALLGVALALGGIPAGDAPPVAGLLLTLASPLIYSIWIVLAARLQGERTDRVAEDAGQTASSTVAMGALMMTATAGVDWVLAFATGRPVLPAQIPMAAWPGLLGVGIVSTFIAIQAFSAGSRRIGAAQASLVSTVEPIWTIALATLLFAETLGPIQLLGGALIIGGVLLAQTAPAGSPQPARPSVRLADE